MPQVVDYDNKDREKLSLYARHLQPMPRERIDNDDVDLSNIVMSHYRLSKLHQQDSKLQKHSVYPLETGNGGAGKAKDKQEDWLSKIVANHLG